MNFSPHILYVRKETEPTYDEFGNPIAPSALTDGCNFHNMWRKVGACRCDDNNTLDKISNAGELYVYKNHIVYEGGQVKAGQTVRAINAEGDIRGEGVVVKCSVCNWFGYSEIWV